MLDISQFTSDFLKGVFQINPARGRWWLKKIAARRAGFSFKEYETACAEYRNQIISELLLRGRAKIPFIGTLYLTVRPQGMFINFKAARTLKALLRGEELPIVLKSHRALKRGVPVRNRNGANHRSE